MREYVRSEVSGHGPLLRLLLVVLTSIFLIFTISGLFLVLGSRHAAGGGGDTHSALV